MIFAVVSLLTDLAAGSQVLDSLAREVEAAIYREMDDLERAATYRELERAATYRELERASEAAVYREMGELERAARPELGSDDEPKLHFTVTSDSDVQSELAKFTWTEATPLGEANVEKEFEGVDGLPYYKYVTETKPQHECYVRCASDSSSEKETCRRNKSGFEGGWGANIADATCSKGGEGLIDFDGWGLHEKTSEEKFNFLGGGLSSEQVANLWNKQNGLAGKAFATALPKKDGVFKKGVYDARKLNFFVEGDFQLQSPAAVEYPGAKLDVKLFIGQDNYSDGAGQWFAGKISSMFGGKQLGRNQYWWVGSPACTRIDTRVGNGVNGNPGIPYFLNCDASKLKSASATAQDGKAKWPFKIYAGANKQEVVFEVSDDTWAKIASDQGIEFEGGPQSIKISGLDEDEKEELEDYLQSMVDEGDEDEGDEDEGPQSMMDESRRGVSDGTLDTLLSRGVWDYVWN